MRILEEYRVKCEEGGDYLEAGRAQRQLDVLRRQETRRQQKAVRARQLCERQDVQVPTAYHIADLKVSNPVRYKTRVPSPARDKVFRLYCHSKKHSKETSSLLF